MIFSTKNYHNNFSNGSQYPLNESTKLMLPILNDENLKIGTLKVYVAVTSFGSSLENQSPKHAMEGIQHIHSPLITI